jgi:cytidylate kinase
VEQVAPLVAVVGVCASGKSTLAQGLRAHGWRARQVLQEHSFVPDMWRRITNPDVLIYLDAQLETTRRRRHDPEFPAWILDEERHRLRHARQHCDIYVETDELAPAEVLEGVLRQLAARSDNAR